MVSTSEIKRGMTVDIDGQLLKNLEFEHQKIARGSVQVKIYFKNLRTSANTVNTFQAGSKFNDARPERETVQIQYQDGDEFHFMNMENFEQPIDIEIPASVILQVMESDLGVKGNTATNATKPAKLKIGLKVNIPLFVNPGDRIKVDTCTGKYVERA